MMKKNLILRLMLIASAFTLHSCVHDEIISSVDPLSKEYHSKSVFKEDEKYIKNVMQVYQEHEADIKKTNGTPLWDYAMTMGHFDESFLIVPVSDGGKIISCLQVPRNGDYISFRTDNDSEHIRFFQGYTTSKRRQALKQEPVSLASSKGLKECSFTAISMWYPDSEQFPDGAGHWETQYITTCTENPGDGGGCSGYYNSNGNCVPLGYEPPTYPYPGGGGGGIPNPQQNQDPCQKAQASITSANAIYKNTNVKTKMDAFLKGKISAEHEWNIAIEQKPNGTIDTTTPNEGGGSTSTADLSQITGTYIGNGHSHAGGRGNPSGGDLYGMFEKVQNYPGYKYSFVYGDNFGSPDIYALIVDDKSLMLAFLSQFPKNINYDEQSHGIKRNSSLGQEFYTATEHFSSGRNENSSGVDYESRAIGMAYILEKFNAGMSIAKADANGNLKKINAKIQQITVSGSGTVKEGVKVSECP
ncbi:hypothetical protein ACM39_04840 [Chryseobacterium sp. FH2]|uniref:hypothetical protein n=1 Tax=Chryseobacterium sp. FH2 TaxID=1674291 RepID=UPI00065D0732|nr:hypothetical protein [Chryseobacterium sp. FH2]KMQ69410.1 hypothetical protein ACM39_04840 [Chryseobacterium sp. FH2]